MIPRKKGWLIGVALTLALSASLTACKGVTPSEKGDADMIFKDYYINVKDFGAVGDGKNDDTAALEAACKSASDGGVLYFPKGTYVIGQDFMIPNKFDMALDNGALLSLQDNVTLRGYGELIAGQYKIFEFGEGADLGGNFIGSGCPQWFGAVGDGVTDDSAAFQRAIDLFREVSVPVTEKGYVVGELTLREGSRLQGEPTEDGTRPLLLSTGDCKHMINIRTGNIRIQELAFDMQSAPDSASMVHFQTSLGWIGYFYINHISMMNVPTGFTDDGTGHALMNMYFEHWDVVAPRGPVVDMKDIEGFFFMRHVNVDMTASKNPQGFPAIRIATIIGGVFEDVHVIGRGIDSREKGWEMPQCTSVWYQDCSVRNTGGYAMTFATQGYYLTFTDVTAEDCQGGIWLKDTMFLQMSDLKLKGKEGTTADGLRLGNVHQGQVIGLEASGFANGLRLDTGSYNYISQAKLSGNSSYGVNAMGSHNVLAGVICHGNGNDEIRLSGSDNELLAESLARPEGDIGQGDFVPYLPTQTEASLPEVSGKVTMLAAGGDLAAAVKAGNSVIGLTSGAYELNEDLVIPQQTMLVVNRGAWIKIADGCTLTLDNAPVRAGKFHIFRGAGKVEGRTAFGYPQWFGALGNLRTDDTAAMQTAVDVCRTLEVPYGSGTYQLGTVVISNPLTLIGTGAARINFTPLEDTQRLFEIRSGDVEFRNVAVKALSMKDPDSAVFYFGTEEAILENIYFENVYITNAWGALRDANGSGEVRNASFYELSCLGDRSTSVLLYDFTDNIMFSQTVITRGDTPSLGISIDFPGMVMENARGLFLKDLDIAFDLESGPGGHGLILRKCKDVRLSRMLMEHLSGYGFILEDCENISLYNPVTFGTEYGGALLKNVRGGYIDLMKCVGSDNWSERLLEYEGIVFENCEDLTVYGLKSYAYRDTALVLRGCKNIHIEGYTALDNWAGELETENCENCTVTAPIYSNNHKKK